MDSKDFKKLFNEIIKFHKYESAFGGWFKYSDEVIIILELQKSSFTNSYYLNIKIFIQDVFETKYSPNKDLIKSSMGHITKQIRDVNILNLDHPMNYETRREKLEELFDVIIPFNEKALSKSGIKELADEAEITLLPAVKLELDRLK